MVLVPRAARAVLDGLSTSITRQSENKNQPTLTKLLAVASSAVLHRLPLLGLTSRRDTPCSSAATPDTHRCTPLLPPTNGELVTHRKRDR